MFRVFAVDPETVARGWSAFSNTAGRFGVERGRLIADYPSSEGGQSWAKVVLAASRAAPEMERKRIAERLVRLRPATVRVARQFKRGRPWMDNAADAHARDAWAAVLTDDPRCALDVALHPDDLDDDSGPFCVPHDGEVLREAPAITALLAPLLHASRSLQLVDPYFMDKAVARWTPVMAALVREARRGSVGLAGVTVHSNLQRDRDGEVRQETPEWRERIARELPPRLPVGVRAEVVRWDRPDRMHARYVLTDIGGVAIDWGLDESAGVLTDIHRLTRTTWQARLDDYDRNKAADRPHDWVTVTGTGA